VAGHVLWARLRIATGWFTSEARLRFDPGGRKTVVLISDQSTLVTPRRCLQYVKCCLLGPAAAPGRLSRPRIRIGISGLSETGPSLAYALPRLWLTFSEGDLKRYSRHHGLDSLATEIGRQRRTVIAFSPPSSRFSTRLHVGFNAVPENRFGYRAISCLTFLRTSEYQIEDRETRGRLWQSR